ncbi:hypothetical protein ACNKHO_13335 [Shigella flexneri]
MVIAWAVSRAIDGERWHNIAMPAGALPARRAGGETHNHLQRIAFRPD